MIILSVPGASLSIFCQENEKRQHHRGLLRVDLLLGRNLGLHNVCRVVVVGVGRFDQQVVIHVGVGVGLEGDLTFLGDDSVAQMIMVLVQNFRAQAQLGKSVDARGPVLVLNHQGNHE